MNVRQTTIIATKPHKRPPPNQPSKEGCPLARVCCDSCLDRRAATTKMAHIGLACCNASYGEDCEIPLSSFLSSRLLQLSKAGLDK